MTEFRPGGFQQLPAIVKNLLIINVLVFLIQYACDSRGLLIYGNSIDDLFALHYWASSKFHWWQLFTHMFMHGGISHIFFNMFALWMFGRILENVWGPQRFLFFYLVCGVGAAICHLGVLTIEYTSFFNSFLTYQQHPDFVNFGQFVNHHHNLNPVFNQFLNFWSSNPGCSDCSQTSIDLIQKQYTAMTDEATIGASGAVFGLLFAFGYLFPNTLLYVYFAIPIKAKYFVAIYALIELFSGLKSSGDNIAHFAHLGGMLFAFILLRIWKNNIRNRFY